MVYSADKLASEFLEIASEQRLNIIQNLNEKDYTISEMAKHLKATVPEIHRNFSRLVKSNLIAKNTDGTFHLTIIGRTIYHQLSLMLFLSDNKKYFTDHNYGEIPSKFIYRIAELYDSSLVNGYARVLETWNKIYKNAEKYIYNILVDVSYGSDLIDTLVKKLENDVKIQSIFSETAIIPDARKKVMKEKNFRQFIAGDTLKRKMRKDIRTVVILNEKEAGVCFPLNNGESDLSKMFYSTDEEFHDWCFDYFNYLWANSSSFQEQKLEQ